MTNFIDQIYIQALMTKNEKSPKQAPEIQMASNPDIKVITGNYLKYLPGKQNDYGCNHMFQVLDESH